MPLPFSGFTSSNKLFYILVGIIVFVFFATIIWILAGVQSRPEKSALEFWGVFDENKSLSKAIDKFESQHSGVRITYKEFSYEDYERNLIDALAAGTGPDIFMIHNTWLAKHRNKLESQPQPTSKNEEGFINIVDFKNQFVDVAFTDLVFQDKIYAMPIYLDTLALFYNKSLLNSAGITTPPANWEEFNKDVELLTKFDKFGNIIQAGAAMGTARNINRSTDILMLLMLQNGTRMTNVANTNATFARAVNAERVGENALQYYVDFANPRKKVYAWNDSQHYSVDAFVEESLAMMFNYSHQVDILRSKAPRINIGIAPIPQVTSLQASNYANYWAPAVSVAAENKKADWQFINFLSSREGATLYLSEVLRPSARRDIIDIQRTDPILGPFAVQALSAKSWHQVDSIAIEKIFADMIDDINYGRAKLGDALRNAQEKVNVLMQKQL